MDVKDYISDIFRRYPRPLAGANFTVYILMFVGIIPLLINSPIGIIDQGISKGVLLLLFFKVSLDSLTLWGAMSKTLKPKILEHLCPDCGLRMTPASLICKSCGGTFETKQI
jgi:hypothetical protein